MGKKAIRHAAKVELDKEAGTLPYLHVRAKNHLDGELLH